MVRDASRELRLIGIGFDRLLTLNQRQTGNVADHRMQRPIVVRVRDAEELVKAVARRQELRVMSQVPLAEAGGDVSRLLAEFGEQHFVGRDADRTGVIERPRHPDAVRVTPGHQRRT